MKDSKNPFENNLQNYQIVHKRDLSFLVKTALLSEQITMSRAAELMKITLTDMREIARRWHSKGGIEINLKDTEKIADWVHMLLKCRLENALAEAMKNIATDTLVKGIRDGDWRGDG